MSRSFAISFICLLWIGLFGCTHAETPQDFKSIDIQVMHERTHCGNTAAMSTALWIADRARLTRVFDRMDRRQIGGSAPEWTENFDFKNYGILFVHMGRQPTGGYALEYVPGHAHISGKTATVVLKWMTPDPAAMVTQVITSPCMMLKMPKTNFKRIEIIDQHGRLKAAIEMEQPKTE